MPGSRPIDRLVSSRGVRRFAPGSVASSSTKPECSAENAGGSRSSATGCPRRMRQKATSWQSGSAPMAIGTPRRCSGTSTPPKHCCCARIWRSVCRSCSTPCQPASVPCWNCVTPWNSLSKRSVTSCRFPHPMPRCCCIGQDSNCSDWWITTRRPANAELLSQGR